MEWELRNYADPADALGARHVARREILGSFRRAFMNRTERHAFDSTAEKCLEKNFSDVNRERKTRFRSTTQRWTHQKHQSSHESIFHSTNRSLWCEKHFQAVFVAFLLIYSYRMIRENSPGSLLAKDVFNELHKSFWVFRSPWALSRVFCYRARMLPWHLAWLGEPSITFLQLARPCLLGKQFSRMSRKNIKKEKNI